MKIDLESIEATARKAQEFHNESQMTHWSTLVECCGDSVAVQRFAEDCPPNVVLALVARIRVQEAAIRFLWNAWSEAEGDGQPRVYVFGDAKMDAWIREQGETHRERAPDDVQAVIREAIK